MAIVDVNAFVKAELWLLILSRIAALADPPSPPYLLSACLAYRDILVWSANYPGCWLPHGAQVVANQLVR